jgi:hypothetical protein
LTDFDLCHIVEQAKMLTERRKNVIWAAALLGMAIWAGCKGRDGADGEPVPECQEYESLLSSCMHRDTGFTKQPQIIPKNEQERSQIGQLCRENLGRLKIACR